MLYNSFCYSIVKGFFLLCDQIIRTLELLPIPNKNMLEESKILPIIQRWSQTKISIPQLSEGDGYSSENTSRAHTPLNTPVNTPDLASKLSVEIEGETPKKLVLRRLKIVSENSMDSAVSDAASEVEIKDAPAKPETPPSDEPKDGEKPKEEIKVEEPPQPAPAAENQPAPTPKTEGDATPEGDKDTSPGTETPETESKDPGGLKVEETPAVETPSQDEEEGISDVESERSQEQPDKMIDMSELASKLLEGWKDLKVRRYRTPPCRHPSAPRVTRPSWCMVRWHARFPYKITSAVVVRLGPVILPASQRSGPFIIHR